MRSAQKEHWWGPLDLARLALLRQIPVEDLLAGREQDVLVPPDMGESIADIFQPVRRAHDVGVDDERHDSGRMARIGIKLLKLVDRTVVILARLVMLDQH